jgi:hypothetical protein
MTMTPFKAWIIKLPNGAVLRNDKIPELFRTRESAQRVAQDVEGTVHQVTVKIND